MKLTFGYSPCPNDTFMFDAIANQRIDLGDHSFDIILEDIADLNAMAAQAQLDITKLSFNALTHLTDHYQLLDAGAALGRGCGPLLVSLPDADPSQIANASIAIPGAKTTANFLLSVAYPDALQRQEMLFSDIEDAVLQGKVDFGLLIHENRFTYQEKGLIEVCDLGAHWEKVTGSPIPLGGIAVKRSLPQEIKLQIQDIVAASVQHAFDHREDSLPYVKQHAQAMNPEVMYQHIDLYVNEYSQSLGPEGRLAIQTLFDKVNTPTRGLFI